MQFERCHIPEVMLIHAQVLTDDRGLFLEAYKASEFKAAGIPETFVQDNMSVSKKHVLRGLHFQNPPHAQAKLVRCVSGRIWDVAVDIRVGSPTLGQWVAAELTDENHAMLYVPEGFAHGFLTLSDTAVVTYKTGNEYHHPSDAGVLWNDPALAIEWPVKAGLLVSDKDQKLPTLANANNGFMLASV